MSVASLNNVATTDAYTDALTVLFGRPRSGFTLQVYNAAVLYTLAFADPRQPQAYQWEALEHYLAPNNAGFTDPANEGSPAPGFLFMGIKLRSATSGVPASVSVA